MKDRILTWDVDTYSKVAWVGAIAKSFSNPEKSEPEVCKIKFSVYSGGKRINTLQIQIKDLVNRPN